MNVNYIRAINHALLDEMQRDETVFVVGEDVGEPGGSFSETRGAFEKFGHMRAKDTPISESAIVGLGIGAALTGLRPVVEVMFNDFLGVCGDQIFNQAAKIKYMFGGKVKLPMVIMSNSGGGRGAGPQHSQSWEALFMHVPGLKVVMPSTPYDAIGLLKAAIRDDNPVVYLHTKALYRIRQDVPDEEFVVPLGKAAVIQEGSDVTVVALGQMVQLALNAAKKLSEEGIKVEVIDPRTIVPLDTETIFASVKKTGRLVTVHEAVTFGGFGAELNAQVTEELFDYLDAPVKRVGAPYTPIPFAPTLEKAYMPSEQRIIDTVKSLF